MFNNIRIKDEQIQFYNPKEEKPELHICFNGDDVGSLYIKNGKLFFTGDLDKSAKAFLELVNSIGFN